MKTQDQTTAHDAQCFLISCMDFRLIDDIVYFMDELGFNNNYDQFILAGSSLGFTQQKFPHWGHTLSDHMGIGLGLHQFREIIFIDHIDCGAFKKFYPEIQNKDDERPLHQKHMQMARDKLALKFPNFKFRGFLMNLEGKCDELKINEEVHCLDEKEDEADTFLSSLHNNYSPEKLQKKSSAHHIKSKHSLLIEAIENEKLAASADYSQKQDQTEEKSLKHEI